MAAETQSMQHMHHSVAHDGEKKRTTDVPH